MNPKEHISVCAAEEAGEVAELAFELGQTALRVSKHIHKALRFGYTDINPTPYKTNLELLKNELNDLTGCIELLQEHGIVLEGLGDRLAIDAKKAKVLRFMNIAREIGTVVNTKPKPLTPSERERVYTLLNDLLNPIQQIEYGQQLYNYVVKKLTEKYVPEGNLPFITERLNEEMNVFKTELINNLVKSHRYYTLKNKDFMDMIDVQIIPETNSINIQPNSVLEVLMHGAAPVTFFNPASNADIEELWEMHKHKFDNFDVKG